jgi:hypothetical protein
MGFLFLFHIAIIACCIYELADSVEKGSVLRWVPLESNGNITCRLDARQYAARIVDDYFLPFISLDIRGIVVSYDNNTLSLVPCLKDAVSLQYDEQFKIPCFPLHCNASSLLEFASTNLFVPNTTFSCSIDRDCKRMLPYFDYHKENETAAIAVLACILAVFSITFAYTIYLAVQYSCRAPPSTH